jgi:hypothetical protein
MEVEETESQDERPKAKSREPKTNQKWKII